MNKNIEKFIEEIKNSNEPPFEKWAEMYRAIEKLKEEKEKYFNEIHGK